MRRFVTYRDIAVYLALVVTAAVSTVLGLAPVSLRRAGPQQD
jgi:hypothetical protein